MDVIQIANLALVITRQLAAMFGKVGKCQQCGSDNRGLLPTGINNKFVCGKCGSPEKLSELIIKAAEIITESKQETGCNCGSSSRQYMKWHCPEHGEMELNLDTGDIQKVEYH